MFNLQDIMIVYRVSKRRAAALAYSLDLLARLKRERRIGEETQSDRLYMLGCFLRILAQVGVSLYEKMPKGSCHVEHKRHGSSEVQYFFFCEDVFFYSFPTPFQQLLPSPHTYTASMATPTPSAEDQAKLLEDALTVVKVQSFQMKRCLVRNLFSLLHSSHLISLFFTPFSNAPHTTERGAKK